MKIVFKFFSFLILPFFSWGQGGAPVLTGDLPNYITPTPEVASILKADFLGVSKNTGAANFSFPLVSLSEGSYTLPVTLNYNSTGVKVDENASMVGTGWSLNYGGVVSRVVMGIPDESRFGNSNLDNQDFTSLTYDEIDWLDHLDTDKQSDIFSFSLPGLSGKFILDQNLIPIPISQYNIKITLIDSVYMNGFIITTDNGTQYIFLDEETSISRNAVGTNCKTADNEFLDEVKTSWYLTKILLPSKEEEINFTYTTNTIRFSGSISQSFTVTTASEQYSCEPGTGPTGWACSVGESRFTSCRREQWVLSKFVTKIEGSNGSKIEFFYDSLERADLLGGLRLSLIKQTNLKGNVIKNVVFNGSYQNSLNTSSGYTRLFLDSIHVRNSSNSTSNQLTYNFTYNHYDALPKKNSFAQDIYGFYNGKNSNTSLFPMLQPGDLNYTLFNNGTGYGSSLDFGDRSIDSIYSAYGMLTSVQYPTGGRDTIIYTPNYVVDSWLNEVLGGGVSVKKVISYYDVDSVAGVRQYIYRHLSDSSLSSFLLFWHPGFSDVRTVANDGYFCSVAGQMDLAKCIGPTCTKASVSSNSYYPVTTYGDQHLYHEAVLEFITVGGVDNGVTEYKYQYYLGSGLMPQIILGSEIKAIAPNIVPDLLVGESEINVYKRNGSNYSLVKSTVNEYENDNSTYSKNYFVRKNYTSSCSNRPGTVHPAEVGAYDIMEGRIYFNTPKLVSVTETLYDDNGLYSQTVTDMEYDLDRYSYPNVIKSVDSKGKEMKTERFYAPDDLPAMNFMVSRNIIAPLLEEKIYYNNVLQKSSKTSYVDWFSNSKLIVPEYQEVKDENGNKISRIDFKDYDDKGKVLTLSKENDVDVSYFWGYNQQLPVAKVIGKSHASVLSESGIDQTILDSAATTETDLRTELNKLRSVPNVFVTTYTYQPGIGISTETDATGKTTYFEYDGFGRLAVARDHDRNVLKKYCYNYFGQSVDCETDTDADWGSTGATRCQPCPANNNYTSNIQEHQERDNNPSSPTYDTYRWISDGVNSNCVVAPDWQNTATALRCKLVNGYNNGEQEQEQKDMNPCSSTYNQTRWVDAGTNLAACPLPTIYAKVVVTDIYNDYEETTATILIKFFSNAACTVPISVNNLPVNYKEVRTNCGGGGTTITNNYSVNCSGTQTSLGTQTINWDDGIHCWDYTFSVTAGTGYQPG